MRRWRADGRGAYGSAPDRLAPNLTYYYSLGDLVSPTQKFRTAPDWNKPPRDGNTHILIVGDSGTQTEAGHDGEAAEVLAGFYAYNAKPRQRARRFLPGPGRQRVSDRHRSAMAESFFDIYPDILKSAPVLPTIGNHEMGYGPL